MKKISFIIIFALLLMACSVDKTAEVKQTIDQITIHQMENFSQVKDDSEKILTIQEHIKRIQNAFSSAKKEPGVVEMTDPHYKVKLNGETFFLWIHESSGTIMNTKDTHVIYSLSEEAATEVFKLLENVYGGDKVGE
ncbi:hypothetical protein FZC76_12670 [Sutcliffiella horikoshii]|uniref:YhfM-like domain-containing protein n=1 Tax=Sutcliffiella horikoshii TaxID=79883 RepID=A0A5D4SVP1_9BACI|nr:hypothetical protein [Sutcliffiella horikoshii]TYS67440.1 hypothetical protein FZC76_12670 [Sutcliffiella horikoshii]